MRRIGGRKVVKKLNTTDLKEAQRMRDHFIKFGTWEPQSDAIERLLATRAQLDAEPPGPYHPEVLVGDMIEGAENPALAEAILIDRQTPIQIALKKWHAGKAATFRDRTKSDHGTAVAKLGAWLQDKGEAATLQAISTDMAEGYAQHLKDQGTHPRTANKHLASLRSLWRASKVTANPWADVNLIEAKNEDEEERAFTDSEVSTLLAGDDPEIILVLKIGLLTGARLEEIFQLRARDVQDGVGRFLILKRRNETRRRPIPLHPAIRKDVERLAKGKAPDAFVIETNAASGWDGARSMQFSKRFARYRRKLGVTDPYGDNRRDRVNFHSARRWCLSKLEQAEVEWSVIQRIAGHKLGHEAGDTYSEGAGLMLLKRAIGKLRLPKVV